MTLYVAIIGLGTLAGILFNVLMNKRVIFKVIGIIVTLITGTFACCVVLFPYAFFNSYNNLVIKLALTAVLLIVIYISARMIVNAVSTIKRQKSAEEDKEKLKAEAEKDEVSVASFALKNRVRDIISADKTAKSPAQRVSVNFENYPPKYASGKAVKEEPAQSAPVPKADTGQSAAKQTFKQTLKDADEKILSESKAFVETSRITSREAGKAAADKRPEAAGKSGAASKLGIEYEQPAQKVEVKEAVLKPAGTEPKPTVQPAAIAAEKLAEETVKQGAEETKPEAGSSKAVEVLIDMFVTDAAAKQSLVEYDAEAPVEEAAAEQAAEEATAITVAVPETPATAPMEETAAEQAEEEAATDVIAAETEAMIMAFAGEASAKPEETKAVEAAEAGAAPAEQVAAEQKEEPAEQTEAPEQVSAEANVEQKPEPAVEESEPGPAVEPAAEVAGEPEAAVAQSGAADKFAALIAKARELISDGKYIYAAELLQMCSDRSEDKTQRKQADILIIECLASSHQNGEARSKWVEFLSKQYTLDEDDKIMLKRVMSSL